MIQDLKGSGETTIGVPTRSMDLKVRSVGREPLPTDYSLAKSYPNPFNPSTQIKFDLPEASTVSLIVYDVLGRQVAELATGSREAGYHSVTWNASNQASGIYFARFSATDASGNVKYTKVN